MKKKRPGARKVGRRPSSTRPVRRHEKVPGQARRRKQTKRAPGPLVLLLTIGTRLVASTFAGLAIGYYTDRWLDTSPYFTLTMLIVGIAAGFYNMYRMAKRYGGSG